MSSSSQASRDGTSRVPIQPSGNIQGPMPVPMQSADGQGWHWGWMMPGQTPYPSMPQVPNQISPFNFAMGMSILPSGFSPIPHAACISQSSGAGTRTTATTKPTAESSQQQNGSTRKLVGPPPNFVKDVRARLPPLHGSDLREMIMCLCLQNNKTLIGVTKRVKDTMAKKKLKSRFPEGGFAFDLQTLPTEDLEDLVIVIYEHNSGSYFANFIKEFLEIADRRRKYCRDSM
ncbi:hypothetical protein GGR52DRAFT_573233 [Hypoxylon sp. FL1284]|nr:hypothetical protein GGR52DRAFT_573233 [Hypoxylon sp. FL1284]